MSRTFGLAAMAESFSVKCCFAFDLPCLCAVSQLYTRSIKQCLWGKYSNPENAGMKDAL